MHPASLPVPELLKQTTERRLRRGGPGGQHRNKVETAVALRHDPTGVSAEAAERRSQQQNREMAIFRLRVNLALEVRLPPTDSVPSHIWKSRCQGGKVSVNAEHYDLPTLLAEVLDALVALDYELQATAARMGVSTSQLTKFLKLEPRALAMINGVRQQRGQRTLR